MFEKEKELYDRLDGVMDGETITLSCEEADRLKNIVVAYLDFRREELNRGVWL
jgi:hypothetical protein